MNSITLTKEDYSEVMNGYDTERFKVIEQGQWISSGKWEDKEVIIQDIKTGKYYSASLSRSGSYYSDYYFEEDFEAVEVELEERTVYVWEVVRHG